MTNLIKMIDCLIIKIGIQKLEKYENASDCVYAFIDGFSLVTKIDPQVLQEGRFCS
jgi:hypothetical protein